MLYCAASVKVSILIKKTRYITVRGAEGPFSGCRSISEGISDYLEK